MIVLQNYNTAGWKAPVLVAFHGAGGTGKDVINAFIVRHFRFF